MYTKSLIDRILRFISLKIKLDPTICVADQAKLSKLNLKSKDREFTIVVQFSKHCF